MSRFSSAVDTVVGAEVLSLSFELIPSKYRIIHVSLSFSSAKRSMTPPTEFLVYEEAIAQLSKPLHTLIKGNLSEAQAGCTIWKEVSKETFERFVQFAYTGDSSIPDTREWIRVAELQEEDTKSKKSKKDKKKSKGEPVPEPEPNPCPDS
jgi:hypothetical protein